MFAPSLTCCQTSVEPLLVNYYFNYFQSKPVYLILVLEEFSTIKADKDRMYRNIGQND